MWIRQIFLAVLCFSCIIQQIHAVVNKASVEEPVENNVDNTNRIVKTNEKDVVAAESSIDVNRREQPAFTDSYGVPIPVGSLDQYGPPPPLIFPGSPIDNNAFSPPPSDASNSPVIGTSSNLDLPPARYGVPGIKSGVPFDSYGPPKSPPHIEYGPPRLPKPYISKPFKIRPAYGPPPKPLYGPPKYYRKTKPLYGPPKFSYGPPGKYLGSGKYSGPPKYVYGPPKNVISYPNYHHNIPDPVPHPPPPGVPAPPTPPEIKYDGWKPIPGRVSRPPAESYGVPPSTPHNGEDLLYNKDFTPPPAQDNHVLIESHSNLYDSSSGGLSDSYGAPLNAVTGSGSIVASAVPNIEHAGDINVGISAVGGSPDNLSVIKSIGYEILQQNNGKYYVNEGGDHQSHINTLSNGQNELYANYAGNADIHNAHLSDSISSVVSNGGTDFHYTAESADSYLPPIVGNLQADTYSYPPSSANSVTGPYAAAHSYKTNSVSSSDLNFVKHFEKHHFYRPESHSIANGGLTPPNLYRGYTSGKYGTPQVHGSSLRALHNPPPKHPVVLREPVPRGVIQSLKGHEHHQKDAKGLVHNIFAAQLAPVRYDPSSTYLPPSVHDVSKPIKEEFPHISSEGSLPSIHTHTKFRGGFPDYTNTLHIEGAQASAFTNYQPTLNYVNDLHGAQSALVGQNHLHGGISHFSYAGIPHDCSAYKSQPLGAYPAALPYAPNLVSDLQGAHGQLLPVEQAVNDIDLHQKAAAIQNIGFGAEVVPSQNIDINSFPRQVQNSYAVQIQSAENPHGNENSITIPAGNYLSNALLQSVLSGVEQVESSNAHLKHGNAVQGSPSIVYPESELPKDLDIQHSIKNEVVSDQANSNSNYSYVKELSPASLINSNEIALYFNKNVDSSMVAMDKKDSNNNAEKSNVSDVPEKSDSTKS